jgi:hypothetical protein
MKLQLSTIEHHKNFWDQKLGNRGWWARYVFHFTEIQNAVEILKSGILLCRANAVQTGAMRNDNASQDVIRNTKLAHMDFVRLYFRPRTPTQYNNEGIRPAAQRSMNSRCDVPIFFCFDVVEILTRDDVQFSTGNLAAHGCPIGNTDDFFKSIPFDLVFHTGPFDQTQREIVFHRHAEVLIPKSLSLKPALRFIACRSEAERQTLLHLLPIPIRNNWNSLIRLDDGSMFERRWDYVERVVALSGQNIISFSFNPNSTSKHTYTAKFTYQELGSSQILRCEARDFLCRNGLRVQMPKNANVGAVNLWLDESLAFCDNVLLEDPF